MNTVSKQPEYSNPLPGISLKISHCKICGKICTQTGAGTLPELCSLVCKQNWYSSWDKDWTIGAGSARNLINECRKQGYSDENRTNEVIAELVEVPEFQVHKTVNNFYALFAIIRDYSIEPSDPLNRTIENASNTLNELLDKKRHLAEDLWVLIFDQNNRVSGIAIDLLHKNLSRLTRVYDYSIRALLNHSEFFQRSKAIDILAELYKVSKDSENKAALVGHFRSKLVTPEEGERIFDILEDLGEDAISDLRELQFNPWPWVNERSTEMLKSLGAEYTEPISVSDTVTCPNCQAKISVEYPKTHEITQVVRRRAIRHIFYSVLFSKPMSMRCPNPRCKTKVDIYTIVNQDYLTRKLMQEASKSQSLSPGRTTTTRENMFNKYSDD